MEEAQMTLSPIGLSRLNIAPTEFEAIQAKDRISQGECDLARLDIEITRAQAVVDKLVSRRRELCQDIDAYKAFLAPVRRLPPEILGEIFLLCVEDELLKIPSPSLPPLLLCQICSVWRNIALEHRALWKRIDLYLVEETHPNCMEMTKLWLNRAQSLPLNINIAAAKYSEDPLVFDMTVLVPYLPTTQELTLRLPSNILQSILAVCPSESMALLETLRLTSYHDLETPNDGNLTLDAPAIFKDAPRLRSLDITCSERHLFEIQNLQVPFSQIVTLSLDDVFLPYNVAALLFRRSVNLEQLTLKLKLGKNDGSSNSHLPIILPRLYSFDITVYSPRSMSRVFQMVTLPVLQKLHMSSVDDCQSLPFTELSRLQTRSSFNLSELVLYLVEFQPEHFGNFLRANPSLTTLDIDHSYSINPQLMHFLTYFPEDTDPILPKLKNLSINEYWEMVDDDILVEMIQSRWWPGLESATRSSSRISRLETLHLNTEEGKFTSRTAIKLLVKWREEGLNLSLEES